MEEQPVSGPAGPTVGVIMTRRAYIAAVVAVVTVGVALAVLIGRVGGWGALP